MFDCKTTSHLAELSKLEFNKQELNEIKQDMKDIISLMDTLSAFSAEGDFLFENAKNLSEIRPDDIMPSMSRDDALENAKEKNENFFKVPKVV